MKKQIKEGDTNEHGRTLLDKNKKEFRFCGYYRYVLYSSLSDKNSEKHRENDLPIYDRLAFYDRYDNDKEYIYDYRKNFYSCYSNCACIFNNNGDYFSC